MSNSKLCGPKPSKKTNAYTKEELIRKAVDNLEILSENEARGKSMKELCTLLNIPYTEPIDVLPGDDYQKCIKYINKSELIETHKDTLLNKGISVEQAKKTNKNKLCDIIYGEQVPFVVPDTFELKDCSKYDDSQLQRIAVRKHIDISRYTTKEELCEAIALHYLREQLPFNIEKNRDWKGNEEDYKCMIPIDGDKELREHQKKVVKHMLVHRGLLAVHSTGTGKTLTAVSTINCLLGKYPNLRVIVLTPLSLVENFIKELISFGIDMRDRLDNPRIDVYSYDEFVNLHKRKQEIDCSNTLLIIDEAHNFRTDSKIVTSKEKEDIPDEKDRIEKGSKSYVVMQCASQAFKVLLLTATPVVNSIFDMRNLLMMIKGESPDKAMKYKQFVDLAQESLDALVHCNISYYIPDMSKDYPTRIDHTQEFVMSDDYYRRYMELERLGGKQPKDESEEEAIIRKQLSPEIIAALGTSAHSTRFFHNLRMAVNSLDSEQSPKVNWIIDLIIKEAEQGRKSVVYSNWKRAGMDLLRKRLDELGKEDLYVYISGKVPSEVRKLIRKKYNKNKVKILLISRAGGEGLDLKETSNLILMESNWNPSIDKQIIGRAIRYKSHSKLPADEQKVNVYRLLLKKPQSASKDLLPSIDDVLYDVSYNKKQPMIDNVMNVIQSNSIEKLSCSCEIGSKNDPEGCQVLTVPEVYIDTAKVLTEEQKKQLRETRKIEYEAPGGISSLAIHISEVSASIFKKLAGVKEAARQRRRKRRDFIFDDDEIIDNISPPAIDDDLENLELVDDMHVEYDPPKSNSQPVEDDPEMDDVEEEEDEPDVQISPRVMSREDYEDIELLDDLEL